MNIPFVDLKAQYLSIREDIDHAIRETVNATHFIGGTQVAQFEQLFGVFLGMNHVISCANGTDAIEIALQALGIGKGDEVIVPANSWISTSEAVNNVGAEPVFADVSAETSNLNVELIESLITARTKAIIPVHLYGLPASMPQIMSIAKKHGLRVIEDCAQSHGSTINGQKTGTFGDFATFSFYPGKNLGAYGDAGAMVTNNEQLAITARMLANHGQLKKHDHQRIGRNSRLDTLQAAILTAKLTHLEKWTRERNQVARWYAKFLNPEIMIPVVPDGYSHVYHLFVIRTNKREQLIAKFEEMQIGYGIHYPVPLPLVPAYGYKGHKEADFPVAVTLSREIISLPMYPEISEEQVKTICDVVNSLR